MDILTNAGKSVGSLLRDVGLAGLLCAAGLLVFGVWLLSTSLGRAALADSKLRRNNMPMYLPFAVLLFWGSGTILAWAILDKVLPGRGEPPDVLLQHCIQLFGSVLTAAVALLLAHKYFARGLAGFGFKRRTIPKDCALGAVNLLAVWPLVVCAILLTTKVGQVLWGTDFHIEPHEELQAVREYSELSVRVIILFNGAVITPVFEEILFRGLFQTTIRSYITRPWVSIAISSVIFTVAHPDEAHWPALWVLSVGIGYSYEKSGSLYRPICMHALFNGLTILSAIYS